MSAPATVVGRSVSMAIGEPWDFESPDGQNALCGTVVGAGADSGEPLTIEVSPFILRGERFAQLEARARHVGDDVVRTLLSCGEVNANLGWNGRQLLIGTIRLTSEGSIG